jgi:hypothetical protein
LKYFRTHFIVALSPYIKKVGRDVTAVDQMTEEEAANVIGDIETYLKTKEFTPVGTED